jgi:Fur family ferric uptake transcriptional regulator
MIIEAIANSDTHISAEEVFFEVRKHTQATNLATVYRTLDLLWEEGFACRNDLGDGKIVYATKKHGPHIHLVCRICGRVIEADPEVLDPMGKIFDHTYGFKADLNHISIFGECIDCGKTGNTGGFRNADEPAAN